MTGVSWGGLVTTTGHVLVEGRSDFWLLSSDSVEPEYKRFA